MIPLANPTIEAGFPGQAAPRYLSDRRRVELALLALLIQRIARKAMDIERTGHRNALLALDLACKEPFADLAPDRAKALRGKSWAVRRGVNVKRAVE